MSARNRRDEKRINRLRKAFRRTPPAYINLIEWLKLHCYAQTTGEAMELILDHRVRSESHTVGVDTHINNKGESVEHVAARVPDSMRETLHVVA